ncbi:hypothetical protein [Pseudomonas sp. PDM13]|uniref:hypothetical protein n=1 Tax=Pseudomonas sp. PDM13 TaxID=2769255 RepID=UPI0021DFA5DB|nr:hypothetical protein [Pseudomonas sp. PDM13]MCU9949256.1 hypothetical protein [Pseudomonas sp. PDM13]
MTLVIAGHSMQDSSFGTSKSTFCDGVFFVSDSNITQKGNVLVSGFKKVIETPVRVAGLNFLGEWFNGYLGYDYEDSCAIAFAGSTLVAQHIMNSIRNHLSDLKPTYVDGKYQLAMPCETKKFLYGDYDTDMFQKRHLGKNHLLTANFIASVMKHSVQSVLERAKKHQNMKRMFSAYQAEFILGVRCPETNKYHVYQYEILPDQASEAVVGMEEIHEGQVAVIGMRQLHENDANAAFQAAVQAGKHTAEAMFDFLNDAIRNQNQIGNFEIGFPSYLYKQMGIRLELEKHRDS